jgi:hypothetical protein
VNSADTTELLLRLFLFAPRQTNKVEQIRAARVNICGNTLAVTAIS